jgi:hypothetical protein
LSSATKPSPVLDAAEVRAVLLAEIDRLQAALPAQTHKT